ncbi:hypothetical protein D3C72_1535510 [compost metagenome]
MPVLALTATTSAVTVTSRPTMPPGLAPGAARSAVSRSVLERMPLCLARATDKACVYSTVTMSPTRSCSKLRTSSPTCTSVTLPCLFLSEMVRVAASMATTVAVALTVPVVLVAPTPDTVSTRVSGCASTGRVAAASIAATISLLGCMTYSSSPVCWHAVVRRRRHDAGASTGKVYKP